MRFSVLPTLFLAAVPAAASATTLSFTPNGGATETLSVGAPVAFQTGYVARFDGTAIAGGEQLSIYFTNPGSSNGLDLLVYDKGSNTFNYEAGPQLYTGSEDAPVLTPGTFALTGVNGSLDATLVIDSADAAPAGLTAVTPEPAPLVLLGTGLVGLVGAMRRRKNTI